ncbi:hypothetical protein NMG46_10040 [Mesorhizobium sp. LMG 17147]|uniref:hypothetical protein n=1 Tax=Mesorhizobium sp. LMG 17147 TaxID=2963091 RepID=UPI0020CA1BCB|nr:hypothetical protein [Mesorhizobium sp. LMG 17147]MCP9230584.1 hypothetical protein [Mesorhizobium sp. LMG 17147]
MKIAGALVYVLLPTVFCVDSMVKADELAVVAQVCTEQGVCGDIEPATALLILGLAQIAKELSKDKPFGPNNEIVKAVTTMINDLKNGPGPNNDLVKILKNAGNDLSCGPGPNNDVIKFLNGLGIKIVAKGCK